MINDQTSKSDRQVDVAEQLVDLTRFPVTAIESASYRRLIASARQQLATDGCVRFSRFILPQWQAQLLQETEELAPQALFSREEYTPYGTPADESFPGGHPRRNTHRTTSGNVTRDLIPQTTLIQQLYQSVAFQVFVTDCLDSSQIFPFKDPMRGLIINAMPDDTTLGWHFDANEFSVSLMTRHADAGGEFEYCPNIRSPGNESYAAVQGVLDGERALVKVLDLQVGDIQIFKGRFSLHRVAPTVGQRHTVIFGYAREPGYIGSVESTMRVYGRVMQEHVDADHLRHNDGLAD
jgi:alkylated DNA repair dioxygenase AlkB